MEKEFKKLTTPCTVFMTFETEEGVERAMAFQKATDADPKLKHLQYFCGDHEIKIRKAPEPSDIIWENRTFTDW